VLEGLYQRYLGGRRGKGRCLSHCGARWQATPFRRRPILRRGYLPQVGRGYEKVAGCNAQ